MLNNKKVNIILSLIIAALLWVYVVGEVQPDTTKQLRGVPITMTRTDVLAERGLAISAVSTGTMDVEVSGSVLTLSEIDSSDVTASVDVGTAIKGENEMTVIVRVPSGITVTDKSLSKINVAIENLTTKTLDVDIVYTGTFPNGSEAETISVSKSQIDVSGAESLINLVDSLRGTIDAARVAPEETEIECELQALRKDGNIVGDVSISQESVTVKTVLRETKSYPLEVEVVDTSGTDLVHEVVLPETVTVSGRADVLKGIETIKGEKLDVTKITASQEVPISLILPEGVELAAETEAPKADVIASAYATKNFTFNGDEVEFTGNKPDLTYKAVEGQTITVTVRDSADKANAMVKSAIKIFAEVGELSESPDAQPAFLKVEMDGDTAELSLSAETVNVLVSSQQE